MLFKKILVFLAPLFVFFVWELIFYNITWFYFLLPVSLFALLLALKFLIREKLFSRDYLFLSLSPLLLFITTIAYLLFLDSETLRHVVIVIFSLILIIYLENIFLFYCQPAKYTPRSLENLSAVFNLMIFFLSVFSLNAANIFLNLPFWMLSLILMAVIILLLLQSFWINKIKIGVRYAYLIILSIIILEFFWALTFLPANFYVSSIMVTIVFYFIWGILKTKLLDELSRPIILRYLLISSLLLIIIIATSPWT